MLHELFARWIKIEISCRRLKVISFHLVEVYKFILQGAHFSCSVLVSETFFSYLLGHHLVSVFHSVVPQLTLSHTELFSYELEVTNANEVWMSKPEQTGQLKTAYGTVISSEGFMCVPETVAFWSRVQQCAGSGYLGIWMLVIMGQGLESARCQRPECFPRLQVCPNSCLENVCSV